MASGKKSAKETTPTVAADEGGDDGCASILVCFSVLLVILTFPFSLCCCIQYTFEYERAIVFRFGKVRRGLRGPGAFFVLPCVDDVQKIDLRVMTVDVPPQEVLTKDSMSVIVDAVIFYRIFGAVASVTRVTNVTHSTYLLGQTMLRNALGTKKLPELLADRNTIAQHLQVELDKATDPWGVKVERVELKNVMLPVEMQRAMAAEAESGREAKAKVIAAEGEQKASEMLTKAAQIIQSAPGAIQLRYLQTLTAIAAEQNETILFPLPMDILKECWKRNDRR